jgi:hypothetical protein
MNSDYQKYLKYKYKYLKLKHIIGGGKHHEETPVDIREFADKGKYKPLELGKDFNILHDLKVLDNRNTYYNELIKEIQNDIECNQENDINIKKIGGAGNENVEDEVQKKAKHLLGLDVIKEVEEAVVEEAVVEEAVEKVVEEEVVKEDTITTFDTKFLESVYKDEIRKLEGDIEILQKEINKKRTKLKSYKTKNTDILKILNEEREKFVQMTKNLRLDIENLKFDDRENLSLEEIEKFKKQDNIFHKLYEKARILVESCGSWFKLSKKEIEAQEDLNKRLDNVYNIAGKSKDFLNQAAERRRHVDEEFFKLLNRIEQKKDNK